MAKKHSRRMIRRWARQAEKRKVEAERCAEIAHNARMMKDPPTYDEIISARTGTGGWKREVLANWGVDWPPPKGWINGLLKMREQIDAVKI